MGNSPLQKIRAAFVGQVLHGGVSVALRVAALALVVLGQFAPVAHGAWVDHEPAEHAEASLTAECSLCEWAATRSDATAVAAGPPSSIAPTGPTRGLLAETPCRVEGRRSGPNPARAPPLHV